MRRGKDWGQWRERIKGGRDVNFACKSVSGRIISCCVSWNICDFEYKCLLLSWKTNTYDGRIFAIRVGKYAF